MIDWKDKKQHENQQQDLDDDDESILPSRTAIKKEMLALQKLGEALVKLSKGELNTIPIVDETLAEAIHTARRIKHREGLRRQMQYIGKLMRKTDVQGIETAYQTLLDGRIEQTHQFHQLEQWRDDLIEKGPQAAEEVIAKHPEADRQYLRQLISRAIKEKQINKPPASARKLFRYLKELEE
jgi:ribosome-associated protein